ncbi:unnamed protein product, partial [Ectocarpus sp. 12 AP-2014]
MSPSSAGLGGLVRSPSLHAKRSPPPPPQLLLHRRLLLMETRDRLRLPANLMPSPSTSLRVLLFAFGNAGAAATGGGEHASSVTSWLRTTTPLLKPTSVRGREMSG